jgi:hypothetical protein
MNPIVARVSILAELISFAIAVHVHASWEKRNAVVVALI